MKKNDLSDASQTNPAIESASTVGCNAIAPIRSTPNDLLAYALQSGAPMETLERLMALQERHDANEARKAYVAAMARFKANPPEILKDKHVRYANSKGGYTEYDHASIGAVTTAICAGLAREGFSHRWDVKQEAKITVTCTITHALGHSESVTISAGADDSGGKNSIQSIASTTTYLSRYSLLMATGLATQDQDDDDGRTSDLKVITKEEAANVRELLKEPGGDEKKLLDYLSKTGRIEIGTVEAIPSVLYLDAIRGLERKKAEKAKVKQEAPASA